MRDAVRMRCALLFASLCACASQAPCNLTGDWCCLPTHVVQTGLRVVSTASYADGVGALVGRNLTLTFTPGSTLHGDVDAGCDTVRWETGAVWSRAVQPYPAPSWAKNLSILELNPLVYTSPNGTGAFGSGSGTWASLTARVAHWHSLGISGVWLAYYNVASAFWHNILTVYGAVDPPALDPRLGSEADFRAFMAACKAAGVRVFLDVVGAGLVPTSPYVTLYPEWFTFPGPSPPYNMANYNYSNPDFLAWWTGVWVDWVLDFGVDGLRLDSNVLYPMHPVYDNIAAAAAAAGHEIAIFGENTPYMFGEHDYMAPGAYPGAPTALNDIPAALANHVRQLQRDNNNNTSILGGGCLATVCFSYHDMGGAGNPGGASTPRSNVTLGIRGSRARFGAIGILGPFIPLFMGGDEYGESPLVWLDAMNCSDGGAADCGWLYGSVRQWDQLRAPAQAAALADASALFALRAAHADVLHHDACAAAAALLPLPLAPPLPPAPLEITPYARWAPGEKALLVVANTGAVDVALAVAVPLAAMGLAGRGSYRVQALFGAPSAPTVLPEAALAALPLTVRADGAAGGGLVVVLVTPA